MDRQDTSLDGRGTASVTTASTLEACKALCGAGRPCYGVEYHNGEARCEIWSHPVGTTVAAPPGYECYRFAAARPGSWLSLGGGMACRLDDSDDTFDGRGLAWAGASPAPTSEACQLRCAANSTCAGLEYRTSDGRCELWSQRPGHVAAAVGYECQAFQPRAPRLLVLPRWGRLQAFAGAVNSGPALWELGSVSGFAATAEAGLLAAWVGGYSDCFDPERNRLALLDASTGRELWSRPEESFIGGVSVTQSGDRVAATTNSGISWECDRGTTSLLVVDARTGREAWRRELVSVGGPATLDAVAFSPEGGRLAVAVHGWACLDGCDEVALLDAWTAQVLWRRRLGSYVSGVAFTPDGRSLAVCLGNGTALLDAETGEARWQRRGSWCKAVAVAPDGASVAVASGRSVRALATDTGGPLWEAPVASVKRLAYAPGDGGVLAAAVSPFAYAHRRDGKVIGLDARTGEAAWEGLQREPVEGVGFFM